MPVSTTTRTWYGEPLIYWRWKLTFFAAAFAICWFATDWWVLGALADLCAVCGYLFWIEEEKERWGV